jgi:hypothetical protein
LVWLAVAQRGFWRGGEVEELWLEKGREGLGALPEDFRASLLEKGREGLGAFPEVFQASLLDRDLPVLCLLEEGWPAPRSVSRPRRF